MTLAIAVPTHPGTQALATVTIVIPVYNEARTVGVLIERVRAAMRASGRDYEIMVVDDGSTDASSRVCAEAEAVVVRHPYNKGNGAAVKTGIRHARGEAVVLLDGDGQHDPRDIPRLLGVLDHYDLVVAARTPTSRQPSLRRLANAVYNRFATYVTDTPIPDLTSGFRAVKTDLARQFLYLLPNRYSYPSTLTIAFLKAGHSVGFVPTDVSGRQGGASKIRPLSDAWHFLATILKIATLFSPLKVFLPISAVLFVAGIGYTAYTLIAFTDFRNMSVVLLVFAVMMFSLGLISEQISQLRFERTEPRREPAD
jgi:glycosyltransferase involved in cell wall biosynthesis